MPGVERCPSCDRLVPVPDQFVSGRLRCPDCRSVFRVGEPDGEDEDPDRRFSERRAEPERASRRRDDDLDDDEPWLRSLRRDRRSAASKVQGPAILLLVFGVLLVLSAIGSGVGAVFVWRSDPGDEDALFGTVMLGVVALIGLVCGPVAFLGGWRMRQLRSYPLAMTATIIVTVVGALACQPLMLVGIWPLIVLMNAEVKASFDQPEDD